MNDPMKQMTKEQLLIKYVVSYFHGESSHCYNNSQWATRSEILMFLWDFSSELAVIRKLCLTSKCKT